MGCFFCAKRNAKYIRAKQRAFPIRGEGCFVCILVHRETSTSSGEHNFRRKLRSPPSPSQGKALAVPPLRGRWVSRANPDEVEHRASVKIHPQPRNTASPPGSPPAVESGQSKRACCLSYTGGKPFHQSEQWMRNDLSDFFEGLSLRRSRLLPEFQSGTASWLPARAGDFPA